jgi:hypothetical protein
MVAIDSPRHHPGIAALADPLFACGGKRVKTFLSSYVIARRNDVAIPDMQVRPV